MSSKKKVLIVEDNSDLRRLYAIGLNQHGYEVKLASNGAEALDRIEHERPDVILLDILMPIMSGWELLERVNDPNVPVVVISGQPPAAESRAHPSVVAWLNKPVSIGELVSAIANVDVARAC